jgi:hypothetical protein
MVWYEPGLQCVPARRPQFEPVFIIGEEPKMKRIVAIFGTSFAPARIASSKRLARSSRNDVRRSYPRGVVIALVASLLAIDLPAAGAQDRPERSSVKQGMPLQVDESALMPSASPAFQKPSLTQQAAEKARLLALGGQTSTAASSGSSHECGWGAFYLLDGIGWNVVILADSNSYKDPNQRGLNAPLKTSAGIRVTLATVLSLLGAYQMISHCGSHANATGSATSGAGSGQQTTLSPALDGARQAIDQIRVEAHGEIPPPQATGRCSGNATTISIQNGTLYPLNVYLSGPESQTVTLNSGATTNLRLQPGHYDVGARVSAPNVLPFAGGWNLGKGCPYGSQFYVGER